MIRGLLSWLADAITRRALQTPYFNLYHADQSLYMGRYWVMPRCLLRFDDREGCLKVKPWVPVSMRLHILATPDLDRDMHDHPAPFISLVLAGGYTELRPMGVEPAFGENETEASYAVYRMPGSIALRRPHDRHRIETVLPGTLTLVLWLRKVQWWGFYTRAGKIHWRDYESVHNAQPIDVAAKGGA